MSIFLCCTSRRRGRQSNESENLSSSPMPINGQAGVGEIHSKTEKAQASIKIQPLPQECPPMSPVLPSDDPIELSQLIVEDSDGEGEADDSLTKTSSALDVVRTKLIRHMSQENESNRRSRISVGHSQEEISRRAELRRFRHQRIQDELKSEESNEESSNTSHRSTRYLSPLIDAGQPGGGPRDTIEFGVNSGHYLPTMCLSPMPSFASKDPCQEKTSDINQQVGSCPDNTKNSSANTGPNVEDSTQHTVSEMAPPSKLHPTRPPSAHGSISQKSLGYSYTSSRLDRILGANNEFDPHQGTHTWEDQSALGIWLIAQSLRSRTNSTSCSGDHQINDTVTHERISTPTADLGGIDRVADTPPSTRQQGLIAPCNSSEPLPEIETSQSNGNSSFESVSFASKTTSGPGSRLTRKPTDDQITNCATAIRVTRPADNSSSNYPSVLPSFQTSPNRSQSNIHHLSTQDLESLELSPFQWRGRLRDFGASEGKSSYVTAEDDISYSDINRSSIQIIRLPAPTPLDPTSPVYSETASFRQREAELQTIEKRFGEIMSRKKPTSNMNSRFKEEFHGGLAGSGRMSLMARINQSVSRRSKHGSTSIGTVSIVGFFSDPKSSGADESTQGNRSLGLGPGLHAHSTHRNTLKKIRQRTTSRISGEMHNPQPERSSITPCKGNDQPSSLTCPDAVLESSRITSHLDEFSPMDTRRPPRRLAKPPESWARYPSHTRVERIRRASLQEKTRMRDYEIQDLTPGGRVQGGNNKRDVAKTQLTESGTRFFPGKLGKAVRSGLNKLIYSRSGGNADIANSPERHEGKQQTKDDEVSDEKIAIEEMLQETRSIGMSTSGMSYNRPTSYDESSPSAISVRCQLPTSLEENRSEMQSVSYKTVTEIVIKPPKTVAVSDRIHRVDSELMADAFVTPLSRMKFKDESDMYMEDDLASNSNDNRLGLRRWKSNVDGRVTGRPSSAWTGQSMIQSLSMNNLRS
ncbi:hypothetical protein PT974_02621 [Cladobotryum mycophilum]|uniref:Uncharacterized protein n=1 Tax=Cladobotryum mycophilum TaxID=491253 RepID=A0ABR0SYT3_9HYPO